MDHNTYLEKSEKASKEKWCLTWILKTETEFLGRGGGKSLLSGISCLEEDLEA